MSPVRRVFAAALCAAAFAHAADPDTVPVPKLTGPVVDLTGTLGTAERDRIASRLLAFEREKGSQVAVLLVPTIGADSIEEFATRVTDAWKLGRAGVDDGVLFVIAKQERKMRIQTGRGVQGVLTDVLSKRIVADVVSPRFRQGDFAGGIEAGVEAIMKAIEGEALPPPSRQARHKVDTVSSYGDFLWIGFFVVPIVAIVLRSLLGRFLGAGLTAFVTGAAAATLFGSVALTAIAAILAFLFGLFAGTGFAGRMPGGRGGWTSGGWGGGGGWSGGSGGGGSFGGGGGSFDGGGASGDW